MRLLSRTDLGSARVAVATSTHGAAAAAGAKVPVGREVAVYDMPRFSPVCALGC